MRAGTWGRGNLALRWGDIMPSGVYKKSEEHKRHISEAMKGMKLSEEHKRKISEGVKRRFDADPTIMMRLSEKRRGRVHSDESKKKMSEAHKGRIFTDEWRRKISEGLKGRKLSDEHKKRLSEKFSGKGNPFYGKKHSDETRKALSDMMKGENAPSYGKHHTEETKRRISEAQRGEKNRLYGKTLPEETKLKISESVKRAKADPKCRIRQSEISKKNWANPDYLRRMSEFMSGPNSPNHRRRGDKHPFWKGGVSFEPYCPKFNNSFKERVRDFFGRVCVECGAPENGKRLHIHHVNFNKMACCDGTKPLFVALCPSCHARTNHNREYWEEHFTNMIEEQYGGECYIREEGA